jgi:periplasmic copper chaperone A
MSAPARSSRRTGRPRRAARATLGALGLAAAGVVLAAGPAAAHVVVETVEPRGDGTTTLTLTFDHGCDGEPTDALSVTMPDGVEALAAGQPEGWTSRVSDDAVSWEGDPVPDGERAAFTVDVRVTGEVGQSFVLPAQQSCPSGASHAWTDTDPSGAHPAPTFVATAATLAEPTAPGGPGAAPGPAPTPLGPLVGVVVGVSVAAGAGGAWAVRARGRGTG